jgi:AI-2 transport protein TqsA
MRPDEGRVPALLLLTMAAVLAVIIFWALWIGKALLLPILIAVISVFVLQRATQALNGLRWIGIFPDWTIRLLVLLLFIVAVVCLGLVAMNTAREIASNLPVYEENVQGLITSVLQAFGRTGDVNWEELYARTIGRLEMSNLAGPALVSIASAGGTLFLVIIYASFMMAEQGSFQRKIAAIFQDPERAQYAHSILQNINTQVSDYLSVKTLINVILAAISFVILWVMGVEYALFWALMIGLLNYIPYVGSMLGVMFPVIFSIVQFGSLPKTIIVGGLLIAAQTWVGNILEPKMIGRKLNMSPFVVLVSLSLFSALWGIAGAILAIPLTSIIAVVLGAFPSTRFLAVLLAEDIIPAHPDEASQSPDKAA